MRVRRRCTDTRARACLSRTRIVLERLLEATTAIALFQVILTEAFHDERLVERVLAELVHVRVAHVTSW